MAIVSGTNQPDLITTTTTPGATDASDQISGNNGGDHISGGNGDDQIHGDNGNDILNGDAGNDVLFGDNGDDELNGLDGNDIIDGGRGDDLMTGGPGADIFVLSQGSDRITDFSPQGAPVLGGGGLSGTANPNYIFGLPSVAQDDFDLVDARVTELSPSGVPMRFIANDDGITVGFAQIPVGTSTVFVDFAARTATGTTGTPVFSGRFTSIDEFIIETRDPRGFFGGGPFTYEWHYTILHTTPGDRIDVPEGTDIAALVGSAMSNGAGGTVLGGRLTLDHISPSDVSSDWFV